MCSQGRGGSRKGGAARRDVIDDQHTRHGPPEGTEPRAGVTRRARTARLGRARKPGEHRPRRPVERLRERTRQQGRRIEPAGPVPARGGGRPGNSVRAFEAGIASCCRHRRREPRDRRPGLAVLHPRHELPARRLRTRTAPPTRQPRAEVAPAPGRRAAARNRRTTARPRACSRDSAPETPTSRPPATPPRRYGPGVTLSQRRVLSVKSQLPPRARQPPGFRSRPARSALRAHSRGHAAPPATHGRPPPG